MLNSILRPSFLIPFALVTPYLFIGPLGVTVFEALLITAFIVITLLKGSFTIKPIIITYAMLLLFGFSIAVINADTNFGIPAKVGDLKIFYWLLLAIVGFHFGFRNSKGIDEIAQSRVFKLTLLVLGLFVASYPFLNDEIRLLVMRNYYHSDVTSESLGRIYSARFPGLGVNANTYAFMTLIAYYIALKTAFERKISWIYPLLGLVIIAVTGSRTVFVLAVFLASNIILFSSFSAKTKIITFSLPVIMIGAFSTYLLTTDSGQELQENIVIFDRLMDLTENRSDYENDPLGGRISLWQMGFERVKLSPIAGIAVSPVSNDLSTVDFCCPHNEFIAYWTFTGLLGLLAYVVLIGGLIIKNSSFSQGYFWIGLYLALCLQMFFDAAFQATRFIPLMFLVIGLNMRELDRYRTEKKGFVRPLHQSQTVAIART